MYIFVISFNNMHDEQAKNLKKNIRRVKCPFKQPVLNIHILSMLSFSPIHVGVSLVNNGCRAPGLRIDGDLSGSLCRTRAWD